MPFSLPDMSITSVGGFLYLYITKQQRTLYLFMVHLTCFQWLWQYSIEWLEDGL